MPASLELDTHKPSGQVSLIDFLFLKTMSCWAHSWYIIQTSSCAGVKLTLSGLIDGKNVNGGGHKVGMGFELEA